MSGSLVIEDINFSLGTTTALTTSASTSTTLTLNGGEGSSVPLFAQNSTKNFTIKNGPSGSLGLVLAASGNFDVQNTGNFTVSSNITETGGARTLTISNHSGTGTGTITLSGTNSFTGGLVIVGGEVDVTGDASLGAAGGSVTINGGRLGVVTNNTTIDPTRNILLGANPTGSNTSGTLSTKGAITVTYAGAFQDLNGGTTGDLVKQGGATLVLGGSSTYSGNTFINNGIVQLTAGSNRLPTGTTINLGQSASANLGALDLNGNNQQVAGLNSVTGTTTTSKNTVTSAGAATLTLGGSGTYSFGDGSTTNSGVITGSLAVVKSGTGTQTLGDANTYTGGTTVSGGTLLANNISGSATGTGAVTVNGGTLGGTGTVGGAVTLNSGGTIAPGSPAATGTLTVSSLTVAGGGTLNLSIVRDTLVTDQLKVAGALDISALNSGSKLNLALSGLGGAFDDSISHTFSSVVSFTSLTGTFATNSFNVDTSGFGQAFAGSFSLLQNGTAFDLEYSAIPEPAVGAAAFGAVALAGAAWVRRRRARASGSARTVTCV
jgi:autotransporter-associated beta strand protein